MGTPCPRYEADQALCCKGAKTTTQVGKAEAPSDTAAYHAHAKWGDNSKRRKALRLSDLLWVTAFAEFPPHVALRRQITSTVGCTTVTEVP